MSLLPSACRTLAFWGLVASFSLSVFAQTEFFPQGGQYPVVSTLPGDQNYPQAGINSAGGYVVWQDNATDGDGLGISAQRLSANLSSSLSTFRVNQTAEGDQENAQVALLKNNGGAVFVWQGGPYGFQDIYARFIGPAGTFITGDVLVNTFTNNQQISPAVSVLADGNAVVVWSSFGQDGSFQGIYAQRLSASGEKIGGEFLANQTTSLNQRSPAVTALANGGFVVAWVSEKFRQTTLNTDESGQNTDAGGGASEYDVDVVARVFNTDGAAAGNEFRMNSHANLCAYPAISGSADGGFTAVWMEKVGRVLVDGVVRTNGWDIAARNFNSSGAPKAVETIVNTETYGDQFLPRISASGPGHLVVWTSLGQDGSREGVFGKFLPGDASPASAEFRVNSTTASQQFQQAVASDGAGHFLVVWSSFVGGTGSFDLFGKRYAVTATQPLVAPAPPYVSALSQSRLSVTWPDLAGLGVDHFELYIDDIAAPVSLNGNMYVVAQLAAGTTHSFRLSYKLTDGRVSPLSSVATGTTWGDDGNFDGLPDDWQGGIWANEAGAWPGPSIDTDGDGATNLQEFLAGTDPKDANSVLRTSISASSQGRRLNWNAQPGSIYQVQITADFKTWTNLGAARFAAGRTDSVPIDESGTLSIYRVVRLR